MPIYRIDPLVSTLLAGSKKIKRSGSEFPILPETTLRIPSTVHSINAQTSNFIQNSKIYQQNLENIQ